MGTIALRSGAKRLGVAFQAANPSPEASGDPCWSPISGEVLLPGDLLCVQPSASAAAQMQAAQVPSGEELSTLDSSAPTITIQEPTSGQAFALKETDFTSAKVKFAASASSNQQLLWSTVTTYQTSQGAHGPYSSSNQFSSSSGAEVSQTYNMVGKLSVMVNTAQCPTPTATTTALIVGAPVPKDEVRQVLMELYMFDENAVTPDLLVKIAERESDLEQFCSVGTRACGKFQMPLYGSNGPWPKEAKGGGHIGVMQVDIKIDDAAIWDWQRNAQVALDLLDSKFDIVDKRVAAIQKLCKGLPGLTPLQRENMALLEYGDGPSGGDRSKFYYVAACNGSPVKYPHPPCSGTWSWTVTTNNQKGLRYVAKVRSEN